MHNTGKRNLPNDNDSKKNLQNCKCLYTNSDSLLNKRDELQALIEIHDPDVIAITEVSPKNCRYEVQECEIALEGYDLFHTLDKKGRGIALHVKDYMKASICEELVSDFEESIFVECRLGAEKLMIGLVYRRGQSTNENNDKLNDILLKASNMKPHNLLILGDFNFKEIDWSTETCNANSAHPASKFLFTCKEAFLIQNQKDFTRYRTGQRPSLLDLVLTNKDDLVIDIDTQAGLGKSDHCTLVVTLACDSIMEENKTRFNYSKADFEGLSNYLGKIDWESEFVNKDTDSIWNTLKDKIQAATDIFVPKVKQKGKRRKKWLDKGTLASVRKKHKLYRRWLQTKDGQDYLEYCKARNKAKRDCRKAKKRLEKEVAKDSKRNPKKFWSYTKDKTKTKSGVADLKKPDGSKTTTDQEKADLLNSFFESVFTVEGDNELPDPPVYKFENKLENFEITIEKVKKQLSGLNTSKAAGPDGLHPLLLSNAADSLALPITLLFRKSLIEGKIPEDWRCAHVCPVFKKGSKMQTNNYRPVSLTCITCKLMETLVREQVIDHLQSNNLISDKQHGFVQGKSCVTQLLDVLDDWTQTLDDGGSIDIIYMDFAKAFDSVPHRRLVSKVRAHGIEGPVLNWIEDFLSQRNQKVIINGTSSKVASVTSGIPQGSVLGPVLFVMYINDMPAEVQNPIRLFADDTKIYTRSDNPESVVSLQEDLDKLQDWSNRWLLRFHPEKCKVLKLGNKKTNSEYKMRSNNKEVILEESIYEKDLGVLIDNRLGFNEHVAHITKKANRIVGIIRRSFDFLTEDLFVQLYKSLVRPILEYGHAVWQPSSKQLCQEVENVQRRATKLLSSISNLTYPERLKLLKLPSLEHRRKRGEMIEVYKYIHKIYNCDKPSFCFNTRDTRGNTLKLVKSHHRLSLRGNYFSVRIINCWNSLPDEVVKADNVNIFKSRLDNFWKDLSTVYDPTCYC